MPIIQTVDLYTFRDAFKRLRPDNFSYEGLEILFEYLDNLSEDTGEQVELDVIAICCDYSEDSPAGIANQYDIDIEGIQDQEEIMEIVLEWLQYQTIVCGNTDDTIIYYSSF